MCNTYYYKPLAVGTGTWGIAAVIPKYLRLLGCKVKARVSQKSGHTLKI